MMQIMTLASCGARISRAVSCLVSVMLFSSQLVQAGRWDSQGAARAFEEASQKRSEIAGEKQPTLSQYLECAGTFRKVYLRDPHYLRSGDAIYEEGLIYEEMGDRFSELRYYKTAANRFHFLVTDYGGNPNCPDALLHLGAIYTEHLKNEDAARKAYQSLRTQYGYSSAAIRRARKALAPMPAQQKTIPLIVPTTETSSVAEATVSNIRYWSTRDYTRVIIDLDRDARYGESRISDPERIYFDISNAKLSSDLLNRKIAVGDEFLKRIRAAQNSSAVVRVVLDVSAVGDYSVSELHDPFRIVIDLRRLPRVEPNLALSTSLPHSDQFSQTIVSKPAARGGQVIPKASESSMHLGADTVASSAQVVKPIPQQPPPASTGTGASVDSKTELLYAISRPSVKTANVAVPTSQGDRTLTRMLGLKIGRIVLDPGHGGHDLGTTGPGGLLEKDLVLAVARDLKKLLEERLGAEVILTRDDDTFISLEERTAIANRHRADLFVSIHANSSRNRSTSGVETYYLDFAKTESEREIAARENATTENNVRDLEELIKKIAQADKSAESRELASIIQNKLYSGVRKLLPSTQNRGVRSAPFVVLIDANMPSALAEVAFISNPKDERLLKKRKNQQSLAKALFSGIESYMRTLGSDIAHNQANPR